MQNFAYSIGFKISTRIRRN